jgi:large subunit ribosomal protein L25
MAETILVTEARNEFGKGAARRVRRAGRIPAVLYGKGIDPIHISLPGHETQLALRQANTLLTLTLPDGKSQLALPHQVHRDPVRDNIEHVDLIVVNKGEKVTVEVPLVLSGEVDGGLLMQDRNTVSILADATAIPNEILFDVSELEVGAQVSLAELPLPAGSELVDEGDVVIITVAKARSAADVDAELAAAEADRTAEPVVEAEPEAE